jgi:UrcA family protein
MHSWSTALKRGIAVNTKLFGIAFAAFSALTAGIAIAEGVEQITVQGTRVLDAKDAGRTFGGVPVRDVSLSYGVNISDLDLASQEGPISLQKRVHDAAQAACTELGRQFPTSSPSDADCTSRATARAMVKANELVAAARAKQPH